LVILHRFRAATPVYVNLGIWAVWFDAAGKLASKPFPLLGPREYLQGHALGADGTLAVLYEQLLPNAQGALYLRTFDARGRTLALAQRLLDEPTTHALAVGEAGRVLFVWTQDRAGRPPAMARELDARGSFMGSPVEVAEPSSSETLFQDGLHATTAGDTWVVGWMRTGPTLGDHQLRVRRLGSQ
jgi:hypothetical protein